MFSELKAALGNLVGGDSGRDTSTAAAAVEYKGFRIIPAPFRVGNQFQTAGAIEKDTPEGLKRYAFIRADTYNTMDDAISFTTSKANQMIDLQGDRIFG